MPRFRKRAYTRTPKPIDITVFADASWDHKTGAAGWGTWFKGAGMEQGITCGGPLRMDAKTSDEAELMGIVRALAEIERMQFLREGQTIMLQCDNTGALAAIRSRLGAVDAKHKDGVHVPIRRKPLKSKPMLAALEVLEGMIERHRLNIIVRHVKGHQEGDGRNWVNRECDRLAKQGMSARRAEILQEATPT